MNAGPLQPLDRAIAQALGELLATLGFPGGVLVCLQPDGHALVIASMPDPPPVEVSDLLRAALYGAHLMEGGGAEH